MKTVDDIVAELKAFYETDYKIPYRTELKAKASILALDNKVSVEQTVNLALATIPFTLV